MSCNHCNNKFNFFHKEAGCSNCGLSFCRKCISQKCKIPSKSSHTEFNVCRLCFSKLTSSSSSRTTNTTSTDMPPPPDAFLKRLVNLNNPSSSSGTAPLAPITMYSNPHHQSNTTATNSLQTGLSAPDQEILDRLEKLRASSATHAVPSENELRRRLATLKGENEYATTTNTASNNKLLLFQSDTRCDEEKTNSLLEQFIAERDIEFARNPQEEIEARLAALRERGVKPNEGPYVNNLHDSVQYSTGEEGEDEQTEVNKITRKIMDEVALDDTSDQLLFKKSDDAEDKESSTLSELPWCVLCNKDAKFRCLDCGGDLYCSQCKIECHKDWDLDHKIIVFKP